ncbi:MAG: DUF2085 domain-containing protein [Chloroflexi bacterium]|nr:DUF2085 domain-containing protein [Chloroflexota bacterium]
MPFVEFLLSGVCHQLASHCLYYGGKPLPLCARCSGAFVGATLAMGLLWLLGEGRRSDLPPWRHAWPLALGAFFWAADGANSFLHDWGLPHLYMPSNALRLITGTGVGLAVGTVLYPAYHYALWRHVREERVLAEGWHSVALFAGGAGFVGLSLAWRSAPRWLALAVNVGSVGVVLSLANALLAALLIHQRGRAERWIEIVPYLLLGTLAAVLETGVAALLRAFIEGALG